MMRGNYKVDKSKLVDKIYKLHQLLPTTPEISEQTFGEHPQPAKRIVETEITSGDHRKAA